MKQPQLKIYESEIEEIHTYLCIIAENLAEIVAKTDNLSEVVLNLEELVVSISAANKLIQEIKNKI